MKFYALHIAGVDEDRLNLLQKACNKLRIKMVAVDPTDYDFSKPSPARKGDMVFCLSKNKVLRRAEYYFLKDGVATFYSDQKFGHVGPFAFTKHGIPMPRTVFCATRDRTILMKYVKTLGGFPVVIKVPGGSRGMGVIRADTFPSLFGIVDFLLSQAPFVKMREYISVKTSARFIVLGDRVIAMLEYKAMNHDFRTNEAKSPHVIARKFPESIQKIAVMATRARGLEFGGVDILIKGGKAYVTEVNFPCNFARAHKVLGKNIALEMVKYLKHKAENI